VVILTGILQILLKILKSYLLQKKVTKKIMENCTHFIKKFSEYTGLNLHIYLCFFSGSKKGKKPKADGVEITEIQPFQQPHL